MDVRKLICFVKGSYIISMPKSWIEKNNLSLRSWMLIIFGIIVITALIVHWIDIRKKKADAIKKLLKNKS